MLKGEYVGLRSVEKNDLPILLEWRNQPEYRQFFREYRELNLENQNRWFDIKVMEDSSTIMFTIIDLQNGEILGACGLCYIDWINRNADFSIYIGKDNIYIDKKYAYDAARVMMKYGFEELNLHRLWTELYDFDNKKIAMFTELGFEQEGCHRETHWTHGKWCNSVFFSLLANK